MDTFNNMEVAPPHKLMLGEKLWRIELYHASVVRGCRELFSRTLLVANKWRGNSTGGVRGRRRREGDLVIVLCWDYFLPVLDTASWAKVLVQ